MSEFSIGLFDSLSGQLEKFQEERRKQRTPQAMLQKDIIQALRDANATRPSTEQLQARSEELERTAKPGIPLDLNRAISQSREGRAFDRPDEAQNFLESLSKAGLGGVSSEGITFKQPSTDITSLLATALINRDQPAQPYTPPLPTTGSEQEIPKGEGFSSLPVVNRLTGMTRAVGRGVGARELQRGITQSLQARATPALKALGEVGVLTDQDIQRILGGGFASDSDTVESRFAKRRGMMATFEEKEKILTNVLNQPLVPQLQSFGSGRGGGNVRYAYPPEQVAARKKAQDQLIQLRQAKGLMDQIFNEADRDMPAIGASKTVQSASQLSQEEEDLLGSLR